MKKFATMIIACVIVLAFTGCSSRQKTTKCVYSNTTMIVNEVTFEHDSKGKITKYVVSYEYDVSNLGEEEDYYIVRLEKYRLLLEKKEGFSYEYEISNFIIKEEMTMDPSKGSTEDGIWLGLLPKGSPEELTKDEIVSIFKNQGITCLDQ